jgi:hypothetical protein
LTLLIEDVAPPVAAETELAQPTLGKILIVTSCTKDKNNAGLDPARELTPTELWDAREDNRAERNWGELEEFRQPAMQLYKGMQHRQLRLAVENLRRVFGHAIVDVKIISAGFGLLDETTLVPPYNATFNDLPGSEVHRLARLLGVPQKLENLIKTQEYSCAFFLLGDAYLQAIELPFAQAPSFPCLFLSGPSNHKRIPRRKPYQYVRVAQDDSIDFSYNLVGLKGYLMRRFVESLTASDCDPHLQLQQFLNDATPERFLTAVQPYRQGKTVKSTKVEQPQLFDFTVSPERDTDVFKAANYGRPFRYFIPDWDDLVDPGYDFATDTKKTSNRLYHDEVYAHQLLESPSYDGLLFSKSTVESSVLKAAHVKAEGIHKYARFEQKPILGDCGAFSYIAHDEPPYHTEEILEYYQNYGFDYGVSIDHLIIPAFYGVKEKRYELTRRNAREFIELHRQKGYTFTPVGVAQGWSPETYRDAIVELQEMGYQYVALGGLARTKTEEIYKIMEVVAPVLHKDTDLHLFGVARDREGGKEMLKLRALGVTSFDSASYLRRAWLSETTNYFTLDGGRYAALRISPVYQSSPRVKQLLAEELATIEELQRLEKEALVALRDYDKGRLGLDQTLEVVLEISRLEQYNYESHQRLYRRTLEEQPWKKCPCAICREIGVEVIIFRKNDRNRRRGFHNTYVFYQRLQKLLSK